MFLLAALGVYWYFYVSDRADSFSPMDLGLVQLFQMVFALFLGICVGKGFTLSRILLLVIPYAICSFLTLRLMTLQLEPASPANYYGLRPLLLGAVFFLYIVLAWIAIFPLPLSWPKAPSGLVAIWRRVEWTVVALIAGGIAVSAWFMMSSAQIALPNEDLLAEVRQFAGRHIQSQALAIYLFLFIKVALWFEMAERYGPSTQGTQPPQG